MISRLILNKSSQVSIIGGGIIGTSIANELAEKDYQVTIFDKNKGVGDGTTSYSSGICRSYYTLLESAKLANEGYQYWKNWKDYIKVNDPNGYPILRECGALVLQNSNSKNFIDKVIPNMDLLNIPYNILDLKETEKLVKNLGWDISNSYEPMRIDNPKFGLPINNNEILGSIFFPEAGYISDPRLATQNLALAAKEKGVDFILGNQVVKILQEKGRVTGLKLDTGEQIESSIIVNAAGCYSNEVTSMAFPGLPDTVQNDMTITTKSLRQEVAYVPSPMGVDYEKDGVISVDFDLGIYSRPEIGNKILIGGSEPPCDPLEYIDHPDELCSNFTDNWLNYVYRQALRIPNLPIPAGKKVQGIVSTYDVTPDWTPIYDKSLLDGYYMAIGTSGNQFKNAGAVGNLMAKLIDNNENLNLDLDSYNLRHNLDYTKQILNVNTFSRKRRPWLSDGNVLG